MPDALDLMVICAEAGLPFTRIVKVVSRELELSAPVLAYELALTNAELEIMPERSAVFAISPSVRACRLLKAWFQLLFKPNSLVRLWRRRSTTLPPNLGRPLILTLSKNAPEAPRPSFLAADDIDSAARRSDRLAAPALMRVIRSLLS